MKKRQRRWLTIILAAGLGGVALGAEPEGVPAKEWRHLYWFANGGSYDGRARPGSLSGGGDGFALGGGIGRRSGKHWSWEVEGSLSSRDYAGPVEAPSSAREDLDISALGVFWNVKGILPAGRFEPFVGVGFGLIGSRATVPTYGFIIPGEPIREQDFGVVTQRMLGVDVRIDGRRRIGLEWRHLDAEGDFGGLTGGKVDLGGDSIVFVYRNGL